MRLDQNSTYKCLLISKIFKEIECIKNEIESLQNFIDDLTKINIIEKLKIVHFEIVQEIKNY